MADSSIRKFSMSYGELIGICSNVYGYMQRDAAEFLLYGITATNISDFNAKIEAFYNYPQDQEYEAGVKRTTKIKNELANALRIELRAYNTRAKLIYDADSGTYNLFYKKDMSKLNDRDLFLFAELVKESSEEHLTELAKAGLTQAMIDELAALNTSFYDAMFAQSQSIANRDNAANERVKMSNELYDLLIKYCEVGKNIWYEVNEAKYNDYVIYYKTPGSLDSPKHLRFFRGSKIFMWDVVANATSYEMQMSVDQSEWSQVYYDQWNEVTYDLPDGITYYRVRAHNAGGFGEFSSIMMIEYYNILPTPENFRLELIEGTPKKAFCTCDAVPTAERYQTLKSIVNIGASPGDWTGGAWNTIPEIMNEVIVGKRNYFSIEAQNEGQSSGKTSPLYIDVYE